MPHQTNFFTTHAMSITKLDMNFDLAMQNVSCQSRFTMYIIERNLIASSNEDIQM